MALEYGAVIVPQQGCRYAVAEKQDIGMEAFDAMYNCAVFRLSASLRAKSLAVGS
ncbi:hypothetical protein LJR219_002670 [Phenylobacterium sp. LjRoot219]|uniref:hypothetical protein n=1 Tax=Phenylobacterium sp. LjRoot219 TaxID=3342283 RepID=UPI003ECDA3A8